VPHAGQHLQGPAGFRLKLIRTAAETDGALLEMEARYSGEGDLPPVHLHPHQLERFEVLEGAVRTVIDGEPRRYEAGESFSVEAGTPHQMAGDGPALVNWQVTPALRTAEFFERLYAAMAAQGSGEDLGDWLAEFGPEIRFAAAD
jgi:mannose-6-phosphate isomerase-like protein (cupin superfamily)